MVAGGSELAFMSITSDLKVAAVEYSVKDGGHSQCLLFKVVVEQFADHGAGESGQL
jgi:hypothetical protein